jgi:hypothetical protein
VRQRNRQPDTRTPRQIAVDQRPDVLRHLNLDPLGVFRHPVNGAQIILGSQRRAPRERPLAATNR